VLDDSVKTCDSDGVLDNGEIGKLTVTLRNNGWTTLSNTTATISSPTPGVTFPSGATINFPSSNFNDTPSGSVNVQVTGLAGIQGLSFNISYNDPGMAMPGPVMASYEVRANTDEVPNSSKTDDVESNVPVWTVGHDAMVGDLADWARVQSNATNYFWHGPDVGGRSDHYLISPALQVSSTGDFTMTFAHRFDFESDATTDWDGGVIELSTDNGANWNDVGSLIGGADGYNGTITEPGANNPLIGRNVFSGQNANYPNFQTVTLNLGTTYAGQTVKIRFRVGTDEAAGANGWDLDNIAFSGIENTPFAQVVAETTYCCPTITVTNPATTTGMLGVFFSQSFSQTGGVGTITFSTASILPNGLTLSPGGVLSGTPTQLGTFPLTVKATDSNGCMGTQLYTLNISCSTLTLAGLSGGTAGTPYSQSVAASPAGTYSYAVTAGALPAGLQLDLSTGALSGTPTVAGSYSFTVTATNVALPACTGSQAYTVVIACPTITLNPASLPSATVNTPYPPTLAAAPAGTTYSFAVTNGTLPPGLTLNANGSFSGAPTQSGTFNFRVTGTINSPWLAQRLRLRPQVCLGERLEWRIAKAFQPARLVRLVTA
jgi:large repetitive protein